MLSASWSRTWALCPGRSYQDRSRVSTWSEQLYKQTNNIIGQEKKYPRVSFSRKHLYTAFQRCRHHAVSRINIPPSVGSPRGLIKTLITILIKVIRGNYNIKKSDLMFWSRWYNQGVPMNVKMGELKLIWWYVMTRVRWCGGGGVEVVLVV